LRRFFCCSTKVALTNRALGKGTIEMEAQIGQKVLVVGAEHDGFAEIISYPDEKETLEVAYYVSPVRRVVRRVPLQSLRRVSLPSQTRCYYKDGIGFRIGRLTHDSYPNGDSYHVSFPNNSALLLPESDFHVRSYLPTEDPVATLASLAQQTPFLFDRRSDWIDHYYRQISFSRGLHGLTSSKVEFFPHQVEVVRRVLQDPVVRYLLADEVGLGKTIEAGIILRQLRLDSPNLRIAVLTPDLLAHQWRDALTKRFDLGDVDVRPYHDITIYEQQRLDILVVDEAHRIVRGELYEAIRPLTHPGRTPYLLLLSATPVLHHERELLALLHLLDPDIYRLDQIEGFRARLERRREVGRVLLALTRSSRTVFTLRHINKCAELLPEDPIVVKLANLSASAAESPQNDETVKACAAKLSFHLTETYRIHRRLLRTRRAMLLEEGDLHQLRSEQPALYEEATSQHSLVAELWRTLEEWRTRIAADLASGSSAERQKSIHLYLEFAQAAAFDRGRLATLLAERQRTPIISGESETVERLMKLTRLLGDSRRVDVLLQFFRNLQKGRWVVFCGSTLACTQIYRTFSGWGGSSFVVTTDVEPDEAAQRIERFRSSNCAVLLTDQIAEEGLNLQFADGSVFFDLPFDPMRLEQRIGRLDRLDRRKAVRCVSVLSLDEPTFAFDRAWYEVLTKGLGLFEGSLADLQFLVERETARLAEIAFDGGPAALLNQVPTLTSIVHAEREATAEQDVLDGLYLSDLRESSLWRSVESADEEEDQFGEALRRYLEDNIQLRTDVEAVPGRGSIVRVGLRRNAVPPLVPAPLLRGIGNYAGRSTTARRALAIYDLGLEFLRPGHPLVEELRVLAEWDERGQAYALWRHAPGVVEPIFLFRFLARSFLHLDPVREHLNSHRWNDIARASLIRLLQIWRSPQFHRVLIDADGTEPDSHLADLCSLPFDSRKDKNLGGIHARTLTDLTGEAAWRTLCEKAAEQASSKIHCDSAFMLKTAQSRKAAKEHFEVMIARLQARADGLGEDAKSTARFVEEQANLGQLVDSILAEPAVQIDSVGVYVLCERRIWSH
jgi:ATP-dependent helicase HepA